MKTLKVFAMMLCIVTLGLMTSCSKEALIVGKWKCTSSKITITNLTTGQSVTRNVAEDEGTIYEFKNNGKMTFAGETRDYKIKDDILIISDGTGSNEIEIRELKGKNMTLGKTVTEQGNRYDENISFEKI